MKKAVIWIASILITGAALCAAAIMSKPGEDMEEKQIRTDPEPIYKLFPDLPATDTVRWCSRASGGIGPSTVKLYVFAIYDYDVGAVFPGEEACMEMTGFYFLPEELSENDLRWRKLENMETAFQSGIKNGERKYTDVYINEAGTVIYMEAVWD